MKWIEKEAHEFSRDKERIRISGLNWRYHKPLIKKKLQDIADKAKINGIELDLIDYADAPIGFGFDGVNLGFGTIPTGNVIIKKEEKSTRYVRHLQKGATLEITYSAFGMVMISISPSKSEDSLAINNPVILYQTYNAGELTDRIIEKYVRTLFRFHRKTGVLHRRTFKDRWVVRWFRIKMFISEYETGEQKLKKYSGLYFPVWALLVAVLTLVVTYLASNFNHQEPTMDMSRFKTIELMQMNQDTLAELKRREVMHTRDNPRKQVN